MITGELMAAAASMTPFIVLLPGAVGRGQGKALRLGQREDVLHVGPGDDARGEVGADGAHGPIVVSTPAGGPPAPATRRRPSPTDGGRFAGHPRTTDDQPGGAAGSPSNGSTGRSPLRASGGPPCHVAPPPPARRRPRSGSGSRRRRGRTVAGRCRRRRSRSPPQGPDRTPADQPGDGHGLRASVVAGGHVELQHDAARRQLPEGRLARQRAAQDDQVVLAHRSGSLPRMPTDAVATVVWSGEVGGCRWSNRTEGVRGSTRRPDGSLARLTRLIVRSLGDSLGSRERRAASGPAGSSCRSPARRSRSSRSPHRWRCRRCRGTTPA